VEQVLNLFHQIKKSHAPASRYKLWAHPTENRHMNSSLSRRDFLNTTGAASLTAFAASADAATGYDLCIYDGAGVYDSGTVGDDCGGDGN
jgi:hypothetical protein